MARGIVAALLPLVFFGALGAARADEIDRRGRELAVGDPYKVRLSAALWLARRPSSDGRTIVMLAVALERDPETTVRRVAALALGRVDDDTPIEARVRALAALEHAADRDRDRRVRAGAAESLAAIREREPPPPPRRATGGLFVHIGRATDASRRLPRGVTGELESAVRAALTRGAVASVISAGGDLPTRADLRRAGQRGFYLGASVASLTTERRGRMVEVRCRVGVRVSAWGGTDGGERLVADGSAAASGSGSATAPAGRETGAITDCVAAVGEEITRRQVVPFLRKLTQRAAR